MVVDRKERQRVYDSVKDRCSGRCGIDDLGLRVGQSARQLVRRGNLSSGICIRCGKPQSRIHSIWEAVNIATLDVDAESFREECRKTEHHISMTQAFYILSGRMAIKRLQNYGISIDDGCRRPSEQFNLDDDTVWIYDP